MTDRNDPGPAGIWDRLNAQVAPGVSGLDAAIANYLERFYPLLFDELWDLDYASQGPDEATGKFTVTLTRKATGEPVGTVNPHWSELVPEGPPSPS